MDNFKIIYRILEHLEKSLDYQTTDVEAISHKRLGISYERWEQILLMMAGEGYIKGITSVQSISDDKPHIAEPIRPVLTLRGLEYLSENTLMKRVANTLKGIKDSIPGA